MNRTKFLKLFMMGFILAVPAAGCKKTPHHVTPLPGTTRPVPGSGQPTGPATGDTGPTVPRTTDTNPIPLPTDTTGSTPLGGREERGNYLVDRDTFKERTVYFELDSSAVKPGEKPKVDAVAEYLKSNPACKLEIEGHCDERGTEEYNRSLGERRALSVREYLIAVGIAGERVSTITYGEDKPAILGHDESAWAKNRRGEFLLLKPKAP